MGMSMTKKPKAKRARGLRRSEVFAVPPAFVEFCEAICKTKAHPEAFAAYIAEDEANDVIRFLRQIHSATGRFR